MRSFLIVLQLCLLSQVSFSQSRLEKWFAGNSCAISADPTSSEYDDLDCIARAIGERDIVMLGELNHGDGTAFEVKSRLVKYLVGKLGFTVVGFEGDYFAIADGWNNLMENKLSFTEFSQSCISGIWSNSRQCAEMFSFLGNQSQLGNVELMGFDNQVVSLYSKANLKAKLSTILPQAIKDQLGQGKIDRYLKLLDSLTGYRQPIDSVHWNYLLETSDQVISFLEAANSEDGHLLTTLNCIRSFSAQAKHTWQNPTDYMKGANLIRDSQMARNLNWLIENKYKGRKIIIWAHNYHIKRNDEVVNRAWNMPNSMGYYLSEFPGYADRIYSIGFTTYGGYSAMSIFNAPKEEIRQPTSNSVEAWLHNAGFDFAFFDLNQVRIDQKRVNYKYYMNVTNNNQVKTKWHFVYDGLVFIDTMKPSIMEAK